ncbi:MAG: sensor histidine kinase, partial [Rickettsiaceae bacterium]
YSLVALLFIIFISTIIWTRSIKETNAVTIISNIVIFSLLASINFVQILISEFDQIQLITCMLNLMILALLVPWQLLILIIFSSLIAGVQFYNYHSETNFVIEDYTIHYLLFSISVIAFAFLKPQQEHQIQTKKQITHLKHKIRASKKEFEHITQGLLHLRDQFTQQESLLRNKELYLINQLQFRNLEISNLKNLEEKFIRNIMHASNTPLTGILSLCDVLHSCYDTLDHNNIKDAIKHIVLNGDRLKSYVNNIFDLSKLSSIAHKLDKQLINLSELAKERTLLYRKLFTDELDKQKFILNIQDNITVTCDQYYLSNTIDNLINNAVEYGQGHDIHISLRIIDNVNVQFDITDQGISIPENELLSIFDQFSVGSKTCTPAGGRGVGLALCRSVILAHNGKIKAKSNGIKGSTFTFTLPIIVKT